ncbi:hypothetical protein ACI2L1_44765, partial [Streptomyces sp. NPDC019531]
REQPMRQHRPIDHDRHSRIMPPARRDASPAITHQLVSHLQLIDAKPALHYRGFTTEICRLLADATDAFQRQLAWAATERFPVRIVAALYQCYAEGETTLRPLAALLGMDVDQLHDLLDPAEPDTPEHEPDADDVEEAEEGDLIFQP